MFSGERTLLLRRAFIGTSIAWSLLLPLTALAAGREHDTALVYASAALVYAVGGIVCHQLPERSFHLWSQQLPVCARCTGLYLGAALAALADVPRGIRTHTALALAARCARAMLFMTAVPTIVTLAHEWITGAMPSNMIRAVAAVPLGAATALLVLAAADNQVN